MTYQSTWCNIPEDLNINIVSSTCLNKNKYYVTKNDIVLQFPICLYYSIMTYSFPPFLFQTQLPPLSIKMHNYENTLVQKNIKHLPPVKYKPLEGPQNIV